MKRVLKLLPVLALFVTVLGQADTRIHQIQGQGSEVTGKGPFTVSAIVTASYQRADQLKGFFIQSGEGESDKDPQTSEGLFVYCGRCAVKVRPGDRVRVVGTAREFHGMSQLNAQRVTRLSRNNVLPAPVNIHLPLAADTKKPHKAEAQHNALLERSEGMRVRFSQPLYISDLYNLERFGQLSLSAQPFNPVFTQIAIPDIAEYRAHQVRQRVRHIVLDDDNNLQNSGLQGSGQIYLLRNAFAKGAGLRLGTQVDNLTGVLHWSWSGTKGTDGWRIRLPEGAVLNAKPAPADERPAAMPGLLKVASFNLDNFFTTLDKGRATCGPVHNQTCRGADSEAEFKRQSAKTIAALCQLDADILGLLELENNRRRSLQYLTQALSSAGCGAYRFIDTGVLGTDVIKSGILYKPASVTPVSGFTVLNTPAFINPLGNGRNRPALAQQFQVNGSAQALTLVMNHLKSKGRPCGTGDDDLVQGNCHATRTAAVNAQLQWLSALNARNLLILGDLNAYTQEDPVRTYTRSGYIDLLASLPRERAYTYVYAGQKGLLDHALASPALAARVKAVDIWHINADESGLRDYQDAQRDSGEKPYAVKPRRADLYRADVYRSSDHDPLVIGIDMRD